MSKNKLLFLVVAVAIVFAALIFSNRARYKTKGNGISEEVNPTLGDIRITVATTGVVKPQNRLEIKPSLTGRVEEILVKEGDKVKKGDTLAWMSSTERAALVDAARSQGDQKRQYWEDVYKKTPIISPIDGEVIVRSVEPGQTVTTNDPVLVLSDRLIVSAQFDETDIGKVKVGQGAIISLDAYPSSRIMGVVDHVAYESKLLSNVTIYDVDIVPQEVPDFLRSGMSANVEVIEQERKGVLLLPIEAVDEGPGGAFVMLKNRQGKGIVKHPVETGLRDEKNVEIISGLASSDIVMVEGQSFSLPKKTAAGRNPFMPSRGNRR